MSADAGWVWNSARLLLPCVLCVTGDSARGAVDPTIRERQAEVSVSQVRSWNHFADRLYEVHLHFLGSREVRTEERTSGYHRLPNFYREVSYYGAATGRLLSRIQWETAAAERIHAIEVFFYDDRGRVARDYLATYLPGHRNAPVQALVNFHAYPDGLHAFRQFDASGDRTFERCAGRWFDESVDIEVEEPLVGTPASLTSSEAYIACFGFLPSSADQHLDATATIPELTAGADSPVAETDFVAVRLARIEALTESIRMEPTRADAYVRRGLAYFEIQEFEKAVADYTRALALDDTLDQAYFGRGMALGRQGAIDEGIADLTVFLERNPRDSLAYTKRGVRYIWKGNLARAEEDLQSAIALDPGNAEAHDDLGVVLARRGAREQAIEHFKTTIRLEPSYQKAYHNLAVVYHLQGRDGAALEAVDEALRRGPAFRSTLLLRSSILTGLGRDREAEALAEEAMFVPERNWSENLSAQ